MPLSKYNKAFGGKKGSAAKAKKAMLKQYGADKGEQVFYATKNKRLAQQKRGGPQSNSDRERLSEAFRRHAKKRKARRG